MLDTPTLIEPPHYVGTFDQFFHRYVLTVDVHRRFSQGARYVSSWDDLPGHLAVVRPPSGGVGFRLSCWARQSDTEWAVDETRLNRGESFAWNRLSAWSRGRVTALGSQRIAGLCRVHLYDTTESRARSLAALADPEASFLVRLARRFQEVIVDEFQDCDKVEHELLALLGTAGIHVVAVADPDQAIYEFRQATSGLYEQYRDGLDPQSVARLTTCHRSAPAICAIASSLRSVGLDAVVPSPEHAGGAEVVHVVIGSGHEAGAVASEICRKHGVHPAQIRVIAHRRNDARRLLRRGSQPPRGTSQTETLLTGLVELRSGTDTRGRLAAARRVEAFVLNQFAWPPGGDMQTREDQLDLLGLRPENLRVVVSGLLEASHAWSDARAVTASVRSIIQGFAAGRPIGLISSLGNRLQVRPNLWQYWQSRTDGLFNLGLSAGVRWAHVHGVKGDEFEGVILGLPATSSRQGHVLDDWEAGRNSEQRRVLYVGATRASKVLVLVVPQTRRDQLVRILGNASVPFELTEVP